MESQIQRLHQAVETFAVAVGSLAQERFLSPLGNWSPRDMVAHLVGWNGLVVTGSRQILRGQLPSYDVDPGRDWAKVNAVLIREHPSRDCDELLGELRRSAAELERFLTSLGEAEWSRDSGVRHHDEVVTIEGTVDELLADYDHHRRQIEGSTG
jgi:uncharacterized protein YukE